LSTAAAIAAVLVDNAIPTAAVPAGAVEQPVGPASLGQGDGIGRHHVG
jgi:hypothetical protein